ncbi:MAG: hypothetical protein A2032_02340 [Chloroflexi bacterium RBG_19FT_COMBO_49_13]|nr:MAG: hypothetical protein A2Y53_05565 [Chloroflexi bacterium RBG_16_47_49]OGO61147.1 MAG: hypothetical protein A2032_02340 [Chloroflexi bacterium RBG_19FT_COMBO_49_13]
METQMTSEEHQAFLAETRVGIISIPEQRREPLTVPVILTHIKVDDLALYTLGAEVFTEIGMEIKQMSSTSHTLFANVSNGCIGYLPTASEHALGGYEVDLSPYFYRLPGRLRADSAERVLEAVKNLQI